jgi:hypothetical protein
MFSSWRFAGLDVNPKRLATYALPVDERST